MTFLKWVLVGWFFLQAVSQVWRIEHPREKPYSASERAWSALECAALGFLCLSVLP